MNKFKKIIADIERLNGLDSKSIPEKFMKFDEEFGEFATETIKLLGFTYKPFDEEHFIEEAADALQTILSIQLSACRLKGIDFERVLDMILEKDKKWEAKMTEYTRDNWRALKDKNSEWYPVGRCIKCGTETEFMLCEECQRNQISQG